jgi:hypothetical protein
MTRDFSTGAMTTMFLSQISITFSVLFVIWLETSLPQIEILRNKSTKVYFMPLLIARGMTSLWYFRRLPW